MIAFTFGFGSLTCWLWLFFFHGPLLVPLSTAWQIEPAHVYPLLTVFLCATCFLIACVFRMDTCLTMPKVVCCSVVMFVCSLLIFLIPFAFPSFVTPTLAYTLIAVSGVTAACAYTFWMEVITRIRIQKAGIMFGLAITFTSIVVIVGDFVDYRWLLPIVVLAPITSSLMVFRINPDDSFVVPDSQKSRTLIPFSSRLLFQIALIYAAGGLMMSLIVAEYEFIEVFNLSYAAYIVVCPTVGLLLYYNEKFDLRFMYHLVIPVSLLGFLLFSFHSTTLVAASFLCLQTGSALINMYTWLLFPHFARFSTRPAAVCAFGQCCIYFSQIMGAALGMQLPTAILGPQSAHQIAFFASIALAASVYVFPDKSETFSGLLMAQGDPPVPVEVEEESVPPIDLDHLPLSAREKEVLLLLLKGRSGRFISESLNISSNTVKFHTRNIYGKLALNNRQDLLTQFERSIR